MTRSDAQYHGWARRDDWAREYEKDQIRKLKRPEQPQIVPTVTKRDETEDERDRFFKLEHQRRIRESQISLFQKTEKTYIRTYSKPDAFLRALVQSEKLSLFGFLVEAGINAARLQCRFEPLADCKTVIDLVERLRGDEALCDRVFGTKRNLCDNNDLTITLTEKQYKRLVDFYK